MGQPNCWTWIRPNLTNQGWAENRSNPTTQERKRKKREVVALFTYCVNSNKVVDRWWWEAHLPLSPGRGGWSDSACGCGVENGGQEKHRKVAIWLCYNCYCCLTLELWEKTGLVQVLLVKRRGFRCWTSSAGACCDCCCWRKRGCFLERKLSTERERERKSEL